MIRLSGRKAGELSRLRIRRLQGTECDDHRPAENPSSPRLNNGEPKCPRDHQESRPRLKLSVGVAHKRGLPRFGSMGASCSMELEVEPELWSNAPDRFRARIREAYEECARAVQDELDRRAPSPPERDSQTNQSGTERPVRLSTQAQARALRTIAKRLDLDVDELICSRFEVNSIELLSRVQASNLIDELQAKTLGEPA